MTEISNEDFINAWMAVARGPEGPTIYRYFQKVLMGVVDASGKKSSALREDYGRRKFASELIGLMSEGMIESGGRANSSDPGGADPRDRPVVFVRSRAVAINRGQSARDHFRATDPELRTAGDAGAS